jgi:hypothetical protein
MLCSNLASSCLIRCSPRQREISRTKTGIRTTKEPEPTEFVHVPHQGEGQGEQDGNCYGRRGGPSDLQHVGSIVCRQRLGCAGYLEENPDELETMATFLSNITQYVHLTAPDLAVSITLDAILEPLAAASDVVVFNLYGLDPNFFTGQDPPPFVQDIAAKQAIFGMKKPFVIQELGIPSGWEDKPSGMNTSPELAVSFCQVALQELRENPNFRAAFWFTLVDWSAETTSLIIDELAAAGVPDFINVRIDEWLRTGGLVRLEQPGFADGTTRPVWEAFRRGMRALYATIEVPSPTSAPLTDLPTLTTLTTGQPSASEEPPKSAACGMFRLSVFCQFTAGAMFGKLLGLYGDIF